MTNLDELFKALGARMLPQQQAVQMPSAPPFGALGAPTAMPSAPPTGALGAPVPMPGAPSSLDEATLQRQRALQAWEEIQRATGR